MILIFNCLAPFVVSDNNGLILVAVDVYIATVFKVYPSVVTAIDTRVIQTWCVAAVACCMMLERCTR